MLRIVGLQRANEAENEFVLLQNQGSLRVDLHGHALFLNPLGDANRTIDCSVLPILCSERIFPGGFVLVSTGVGQDGFAKTVDGSQILRIFGNRSEPLWSRYRGELSILAPQHTFSEGTFVSACIQCGIKLGAHPQN